MVINNGGRLLTPLFMLIPMNFSIVLILMKILMDFDCSWCCFNWLSQVPWGGCRLLAFIGGATYFVCIYQVVMWLYFQNPQHIVAHYSRSTIALINPPSEPAYFLIRQCRMEIGPTLTWSLRLISLPIVKKFSIVRSRVKSNCHSGGISIPECERWGCRNEILAGIGANLLWNMQLHRVLP